MSKLVTLLKYRYNKTKCAAVTESKNDDVCHKEREEKMKFFHVGDLHLGKQLHGYDLIKDQEHMLEELLSYIKKEQPDAVLIAGDIYDRAVPSGTAMQLLEHFFIRADELAKIKKQ